jgi:hypothetical protein
MFFMISVRPVPDRFLGLATPIEMPQAGSGPVNGYSDPAFAS